MIKQLSEGEMKLLTGTPEVVQMLRNRVTVPDTLQDGVLDFLEVNAMDLWFKNGIVGSVIFYFLDAQDMANIRSLVQKSNQF